MNNRTRVLFFIHDLKHGGAEKVLVNLVNNMNIEKYDVTVMTLFDVGVNKQFLSPNIKYKTYFTKEFRGNKYILKLFKPETLYKKMITEEYDVVISYLEGICNRIISGCNNPKTKKIAWRHISETDAEYVQCYISKKEADDIYNKYDFIAGVSESVIENFLKLSGHSKDNYGVIYNTNETEKIKELSKEKVVNKEFDCDGLKIIGVAKVRPRKGFMRLAQVHKRLIEEGYKYKIFVLGEGEERKKIEEYLEQNGIKDSFHFLGYDPNPYKYVAKCDLFVCPSFEEGFSTAATESLVVGTPVLTTLCSGMKEMLGENDEYGVIVENSTEGIYSGLKRFLDNPELFNHYHKKAIERREIFSTEKTVKSVEDLIDSVLEN